MSAGDVKFTKKKITRRYTKILLSQVNRRIYTRSRYVASTIQMLGRVQIIVTFFCQKNEKIFPMSSRPNVFYFFEIASNVKLETIKTHTFKEDEGDEHVLSGQTRVKDVY